MVIRVMTWPPRDPLTLNQQGRAAWWWIALALLAAAFVLRAAHFWNPINGLDEEYYVLVGDRMLHGAIPYVDLWDRKPWGLFALFASIERLGGAGMLAPKVAGTLFAAATAFLVARFAARYAPRWAAVLSGLFYLLMLHQLQGGEPQSPVFYNLLITGSYLLAIDTRPALEKPADRRRVLIAMLLAGLAIQLKTNAVFEGAPLGAWLVWRMIRAGVAWRRILALATPMALLALAPTLAVMAGYAAIGHFDAWWFANVRSLLLKHGTLAGALPRLRDMACAALPLLLLAAIGIWRGGNGRWRRDRPVLLLWIGAALLDAVALGGFWTHYALPLAVPASILAANAFAQPRWAGWLFALFGLYPAIDAIVLDPVAARDDARIAAATTAAIPADVPTRCLFIYEGPVIYYQLTHACLVTRYAFTDHLRSAAEAPALGENAALALRAALRRAPGTILTLDHVGQSANADSNHTNDAILADDLAKHYHRVARFPHTHLLRGREWLVVWRRNAIAA